MRISVKEAFAFMKMIKLNSKAKWFFRASSL